MIYNIQVIDVADWDSLVEATYGKPYNFQQAYGCQDRQHFPITIPSYYDDEFEDVKPETVSSDFDGVNFQVWKFLPKEEFDEAGYEVHWGRNFYPDIQMVANDLYEQGLIPAGEYKINIDW